MTPSSCAPARWSTRNHRPRDLVCHHARGVPAGRLGPDPAAYERIKFLPNGPDGCQISPSEPAKPAQEEREMNIVHADVA